MLYIVRRYSMALVLIMLCSAGLVQAQPTISSFTPTSGVGGTRVTITGTNFTGATSLTIGGQAVHSYWVSSATTIVAVVGTGATGNVEVRTSTGIGTSGTNFTVTGPGVFGNPIPTAATLVLGQSNFTSNTSGAARMNLPSSVAVDPTTGKVFVSDRENNRILRYASYSALSNGIDPEGVLGQANFTSVAPNQGGRTASSLNNPYGVFVDGAGRLWVADEGNRRILRYDNAANKANGAAADGVLGQANFTAAVESVTATGLRFPYGLFVDGGGRLWVADESSHRVLRYDNAANKANGAAADGVLGQPNFTTANDNATATGLHYPYAVHVDGGGRLWVADESNNRILRYDNAANKANGAAADGVLGQPNFTSFNPNDPVRSATTLRSPFGLYADGAGRLWVADELNNRILRYDNAANKSNGAAADGVLGQANFTTDGPGVTATTFDSPNSVHVDAAGRLWVADQYNNRVLVYEGVPPVTSITSLSPTSTVATASAFPLTINGSNFQGTTTLTISVLDSQGVPTGTLNLLPFITSSSATQIVVNLPAGVAATVGTLTVTLSALSGTTTAVFFVQGDNIIVTTNANDGGGSLRRAFQLTSPGGTIQIQPGVDLSVLTGGPIVVDKNISLIGNVGGFTINGNGAPVFIVSCGGNLRLENVNIRNANNVPAIQNDCGNIRLLRVNVTGN